MQKMKGENERKRKLEKRSKTLERVNKSRAKQRSLDLVGYRARQAMQRKLLRRKRKTEDEEANLMLQAWEEAGLDGAGLLPQKKAKCNSLERRLGGPNFFQNIRGTNSKMMPAPPPRIHLKQVRFGKLTFLQQNGAFFGPNICDFRPFRATSSRPPRPPRHTPRFEQLTPKVRT